jgi:hypothetical protein
VLRSRPRAAVASFAVAVLLLGACGEDPTMDVPPAEDEVTPDDGDDAVDGFEEDPDPLPEPDDGGDAIEDDEVASPTPDPELVDDPCRDHEDRDDEAFISVVSPVGDQHVSDDTVELIGCSNVFEANVQWSLYDGDGRELETGFTTATCGSGCVGEFRDEVSLEAFADEPYAELHVYSEDASGEEDRQHLTAIPLVLS